MNRNAAFGVGALLGAAAALVWNRRSELRAPPMPAPDARAAELREKLAEAKRAEVDESDFGAAGMGAETIVEEAAPTRPPAPPPPPPDARPQAPPAPPRPPPGDEFEAMRRRIHEEGQAAAEDMRREPDDAS
ncbi:MAG: hypothetical protein ABI649_02750 [Gaiellaceae bacterium]